MTPPEERCRILLNEALTLDRDGFVITLEPDIFRQSLELARALDLDLPRWLGHVRWFYLSADLLQLTLPPDAWRQEARHFAADCAHHALLRLPVPHPEALDAVEAAHRFADGELSLTALSRIHLNLSTTLRAHSMENVAASAALAAATHATHRNITLALQGAAASALWSVARQTHPRSARAYAQEQRWQQERLLRCLHPSGSTTTPPTSLPGRS